MVNGRILRKEKGITLIALIITIIVLLILAIVSIRLVINDGIIGKANEGTEKYSNEEIKEKIATAYAEYQMSQFQNQTSLEQALTNSGLTGSTVQETDEGWTITYAGKEFTLSKTGTVAQVEPIDWDTVIANAQKHPEQSDTIPEIGIDMYGNPVNLDLWNYDFNETDKTFRTTKQIGSKSWDLGIGYVGNIVDGKIIGEIPQYIKKDNETYTLTSLEHTFYGSEIVIAPTIPNTVTNISDTFRNCTSLTTVGNIPDSVIDMGSAFSECPLLTTVGNIGSSVTDMNYTFYGCTSLTQAPTIPNSVTDMYYTFCKCTSLTTVGDIPDSVINIMNAFAECTSLTTVGNIGSSVTDMYYTFYKCTSLTGRLIINANGVPSIFRTLEDAATNEGCNLVVSGTCPQLDEIIATKSENSHITKGN